MPKRNVDADLEAVWMLADQQDGLVTRGQLIELGVSPSVVADRVVPRGPWTRPLPGVYAFGRSSPLTARQRARAAVLYAGRGALLTGATAVKLHGLRAAGVTERTDVVIPASARRASRQFAVVQRTWRMPVAAVRESLPCVPIARAVVGTCRFVSSLQDVRAVVAEAVQTGRCGLEPLRSELVDGPIQHSALCRQALDEVMAGPRSVPEINARQLFRDHRLPEPRWNVDLYSDDGIWIARPDAYWEEGVAYEQDSREYHLSPKAWKRTMDRHARMTSYGILVIHAPPSRLCYDGMALVSEIRSTIINAARGPRPRVVAIPRV